MAKIVIDYNIKTGQLSFNGPTDKVLALGMMELAKALLTQKNTPDPEIVIPKLTHGA